MGDFPTVEFPFINDWIYVMISMSSEMHYATIGWSDAEGEKHGFREG